jgi:hypothetical protein
MDPKMDSGLLEPEYEHFDAWKPRLPEEIIGIMDRLLCNEVRIESTRLAAPSFPVVETDVMDWLHRWHGI